VNAPLVTIVIPTHERQKYAIPTIRAMLALSPQPQVVVCDTSEVDLISPSFAGVPESVLRILRPGRKLSMVDNFSAGLAAAGGRYVCFLGDDDFVSAELMQLASWAEDNGVDCINCTFPANYYWPDFRHRTRGDYYAGTLQFKPFEGGVRMQDSRSELGRACANLGGGVMDLPRLYAGLVSSALLRRIREKYGHVFGAVSPDIYSAALIALESRKTASVDFPIIVPGASAASAAGQSASGRHVGGLRDSPQMAPYAHLAWDERVPAFYSVPTVWAYSLTKAVETAGVDLELGFARLYVKCLLFQRAYHAYTLHAMRVALRDMGVIRLGWGLLRGACAEAGWIGKRLYQKLRERLSAGGDGQRRGLEDPSQALAALGSYVSEAGVRPAVGARLE
jgi:hypothetical protein